MIFKVELFRVWTFEFELGCAGGPKAAADIRPVIAAETANPGDIGVSGSDCLVQVLAESDDIGNAVSAGQQSAISVIGDLVPPYIAVKSSFHVDRHLGAADLYIRIAEPGQAFASCAGTCGTPVVTSRRRAGGRC